MKKTTITEEQSIKIIEEIIESNGFDKEDYIEDLSEVEEIE